MSTRNSGFDVPYRRYQWRESDPPEAEKLQDNVTLELSSAKTAVLFGLMTFPKTAAKKEEWHL